MKGQYSDYRLFSPVLVDGNENYITHIPNWEEGIDYYLVSGDTSCHPIDDLFPIPLDKGFYKRHSDLFRNVNGVFECSANSHVVSVDDSSFCCIDGEEYGHVYRHELINILSDVLRCHILLPDIGRSGIAE